MLQDDGYRKLKISPEMIGELAKSISKKGFEHVTLVSGVITIVGFMVTGKQAGKRVIILGADQEVDSHEQ